MMVLALDEGRDDKGIRRMSAAAITELLTPVMSSYALGVRRSGPTFWHSGRHGGEGRTQMCGNPAEGDGIVVLTNADSPTSNGGANDVVGKLIGDIIRTYVKVKKTQGWASNANCM